MNIDFIRGKSAEIMKKASAEYQALRTADQKAKAETLKPGENIGFPTYNQFYNAEYREKCDDILSGYRSQMNNLLDEVRAEIKTKSAEPPTSDQANILTALSIGEPTETELLNALEMHSGNFSTYSALQRIANKNGYHFDDKLNPLNNLHSLQMELANNNKGLYTDNAETRLSGGYQEFAELMGNVFHD